MRERCLVDRILEPGALSVEVQPVYEVRGDVVGTHYLECLIRGPKGSTVESPDVLFEYVRRKDRLAEVERAVVAAILRAVRVIPGEPRLGLNIHACTLAQDPEFLNFLSDELARYGVAPSRLVMEIVEHAPPWDVTAFRTVLAGLRDIGAQIALDDVGLGHSNYMMILECRPDYFKIDRYFVTNCTNDFYRQAVLASVAQLARPFGAQVVAEGVESHDDLTAVTGLGIGLVQGWLFSSAVPVALFAQRALDPMTFPPSKRS